MWPGFDEQANSPTDTLDYLELQSLAAPLGVATGFIVVRLDGQPAAMVPFYVSYLSKDDHAIPERQRRLCRFLGFKHAMRWMRTPVTPLGMKSVCFGGLYNFQNGFYTASGTARELRDEAVLSAFQQAARRLQFRHGAPAWTAVNFQDSHENREVFRRWGMRLTSGWPDTVIDFEKLRSRQARMFDEHRDPSSEASRFAPDQLAGPELTIENYPCHLRGQNARHNFRRNRTRCELHPDFRVEEIQAGHAKLLLPGIMAAYRSQFHRARVQGFPFSSRFVRLLLDLPITRPLVAWHDARDGSAPRLAGFAIVLEHAGVRVDLRMGVVPEFRPESLRNHEALIWPSIVTREIAGAIAAGTTKLHCGPTFYQAKMRMGYELAPVLNAFRLVGGASILRDRDLVGLDKMDVLHEY